MKKEYIIKQSAETVWWYTFTEQNTKGEKLVIELSKCTNHGGNNALPVLWHKNGYIDKVLETYWNIQTYVTDTEGMCYGRYNPQHKQSEDGKRNVINFYWMFEDTEANKEKLFDNAIRIFSTAKGETATEEKHRKVREYAEEKNIEVLTEMPEGWLDLGYCTAPIGSIWIGNIKPNIHNFRDKNRKEALLLI
jgi:hypothetical protein